MITAAIALASLAFQQMPDNPSFDYSGLPEIRGSDAIGVLTHSVVLEIDGTRQGFVDVSSTTQYKNMSSAPVTAYVSIPRRRFGDATSSFPSFDISATWDRRPLKVSPVADHGTTQTEGKVVQYSYDLGTKLQFAPGATYGLRINYQVPIGKGGYEQKKRLVGYLMGGNRQIGTLNVTYRYGGTTVFSLPDAAPSMGWEIGEKGAFVRKENYMPSNQLTLVSFYPGGF